jgi:hypothetical protein
VSFLVGIFESRATFQNFDAERYPREFPSAPEANVPFDEITVTGEPDVQRLHDDGVSVEIA